MIRPVVKDKPMQQISNSHMPFTWSERWDSWVQRRWQMGYLQLMHQLPVSRDAAVRILEVGSGRGDNLMRFARHFVNAQLVGLEALDALSAKAEQYVQPYSNRIDVYHSVYAKETTPVISSFDVLLLPYQLSKATNWSVQLERAYRDLKPGGIIAVLDFYKDPIGMVQRRFFPKHQLSDALLPTLKGRFAPLSMDIFRAYLGLWHYFSFIGIKPYA